MKIISIFGFLALFGIWLYLSRRQQTGVVESLRGGTLAPLRSGLMFGVLILLGFAELWMLTRVFPWELVLILLGAAVVAIVVHYSIGTVFGFTQEENATKVGALAVITGFITGANNPFVVLANIGFGLLLILVMVVGSLYTFVSHPIGDPEAKVLIAFFYFTVPYLLSVPVKIAMLWPIVTSPYNDNDLRNSFLSSEFSSIIYWTIYLLFPIWLFKNELSDVVGKLPPLWLLLSIPLLVFIIGVIFPVFLGIYRYRHRARQLLLWQRNWLLDVLETVQTPFSDQGRSERLMEKHRELQTELERWAAESKLFQFYMETTEGPGPTLPSLLPGSQELDDSEPNPPQAGEYIEGELPLAAAPGTSPASPDLQDGIRSSLREVRNWLKPRKPIENPVFGGNGFESSVLSMVTEHRGSLVQ